MPQRFNYNFFDVKASWGRDSGSNNGLCESCNHYNKMNGVRNSSSNSPGQGGKNQASRRTTAAMVNGRRFETVKPYLCSSLNSYPSSHFVNESLFLHSRTIPEGLGCRVPIVRRRQLPCGEGTPPETPCAMLVVFIINSTV